MSKKNLTGSSWSQDHVISFGETSAFCNCFLTETVFSLTCHRRMAGSQVEGLVFGRKPLSTLKPVRLSANPGIPGSMTCNENGLRRFHRKSEWSSQISVANDFGFLPLNGKNPLNNFDGLPYVMFCS